MAELVKAPDSRSGGGYSAWVRIPLLAAFFAVPKRARAPSSLASVRCVGVVERKSRTIWCRDHTAFACELFPVVNSMASAIDLVEGERGEVNVSATEVAPISWPPSHAAGVSGRSLARQLRFRLRRVSSFSVTSVEFTPLRPG